MKRVVLCIFCAVLLAAAFSSCSKKGDVIPRSTLSKIYAELFIADSWLSVAPLEDRNAADTLAFYEPVFKEYGYTTSDYLTSVEYYLNDPERFARILKKTRAQLRADLDRLDKQLGAEREAEEAERERNERLDSIAALYVLYKDYIREAFFTDRVMMISDERGVYFPSPCQEEMSYLGPRLIFKSDSLEVRDKVEGLEMKKDGSAIQNSPSIHRELKRNVLIR